MYRLLIVLLLAGCAASKSREPQPAAFTDSLRQHVSYLADDNLQGRRTGTEGEKLAADYISGRFAQMGLLPAGNAGYLQPFTIDEGKKVSAESSLVIEGNRLALEKEFFPLGFSGNGKVEAMPSIALNEQDMPWFQDVSGILNENTNNPHFDLEEWVYNKAADAAKKGATAFIVYNTGTAADGLKFDGRSKRPALKIPVVYVMPSRAREFFSDRSAMVDLELSLSLVPKIRTGHNVVAQVDNGAANTVIIGAHYDHLGFGEDHNSRHTGTEKELHNGADDNASGTAAMLELARMIKKANLKNHNYVFVAFSGEELGLYGSKHFVQQPPVSLRQVSYMINMDMVGRLNDSSKTLTVGGYGTSPAWGAYYGNSSFTNNSGLVFRFDSSGTGPSDHTSFYVKDIPVLFYFTGLHSDYHKPSDDADKINYRGMASIVQHIFSLVKHMDAQPKPAFTKTREVQTTTSARFSVSLGIMPDYTYSGSGVRVDGVSDGRPAQKAGIKAGDVVTAIGDHATHSVEAYMQALSRFKKGDKTTVQYKRGNETFSSAIEF